MDEQKQDLVDAFNKLPTDRQGEICEFYETKPQWIGQTLARLAKAEAQSAIDYADRHDYGYGEVGYNINESVKDFAEDVPELENEYKHLVRDYFNLLVEAKES